MKNTLTRITAIAFATLLCISSGPVSAYAISDDSIISYEEYVEKLTAEGAKYGVRYEANPEDATLVITRGQLEQELEFVRNLGEAETLVVPEIIRPAGAPDLAGIHPFAYMPYTVNLKQNTDVVGLIPPFYAELTVTVDVTINANGIYQIMSAQNVGVRLRGGFGGVHDYLSVLSTSTKIQNTGNSGSNVVVSGRVELKVDMPIGNGWMYKECNFSSTFYPF